MSAAATAGELGAGITLLQASAGTGKTFRIAHTMLRLIAEEGIPIGRIVVVTFTIAATAELRDRVRRRLQEARRGVVAAQAGKPIDDLDEVLAAWIPTAPAEAAVRLRRALVDFDEASIATIHGFCNRALARHAFESGASFGAELVGDVSGLLEEFVVDFWTRLVVDAPADLLPGLRAGGITRETLHDLAKKVDDPDRPVLPDGPIDVPLPDLGPWREALEEARAAWETQGEEAVGLLLETGALRRRASQGRGSFPPGRTRDHANAMDRWCTRDPALIAPVASEVIYFTPAQIEDATLDGHDTPTRRLFELLDAYAEEHERVRPEMVAWILSVKRQLVEAVRTAIPAMLLGRHVRTYDQMLRLLRDALCDEARRDLLYEGLRGDYDVALIDEFQDTDAVQWTIFHEVFADRLCLIGDPKQAIYGFRGADVFTYRRAARLLDHQATLDTNYRSDPLLVEAINHLFGREGLRRPFGTDDIPFEPVAAHHAEARLIDDERPPLELRFMPRDGARLYQRFFTRSFTNDRLPGVVADDVAAELSREGTLRTDAGEVRRVGPRDCAVLVRSHAQAGQIQAALRSRGIPCVLRSDKSVLESDEADELGKVLAAVLEPNAGNVRVALTTPMLGRTGSEVAVLEVDEGAWSEIRLRFARWRSLWVESGCAAMMRDLLDSERVATRLLSQGRSRDLTNLLHIGELLHDAAMRERLGPIGLASWLARVGPGVDPDTAALRLESDADAVQVVTMHGCKGLEYPLVWCPYLWQSGFLSTNDEMHLRFHDPKEDFAPKLDIGSPDMDEHVALAKREQLEEDLRILYVAITRARHRCTVYTGAAANSSALAYILHQQPDYPLDDLAARANGRLNSDREMLLDLEALSEHPGIAHSSIDWSAPAGPGWRAVIDDTPLVARTITREQPPDGWWRRTSYSALVSGVPSPRPDSHRDVDGDVLATDAGPVVGPAEIPLHDLPGGSGVGLLFHRVFELHDFRDAPALSGLVASELSARGFDPGWEPRVTSAIQSTLDTPLADGGPRLADISTGQRLDELEFVLPIRGGLDADSTTFSVSDLAGVFDAPDAPAGYAQRLRGLAFLPVRGFLVGSIDLVFEHDGRYFLADYKSNHLGTSYRAYAAAELPRQMAVSSYVLQYHLYTLALHRYLARRVAGYDYEEHFGGALYLFLRGMAPERGPASGIFRDRPRRSLVERLDALMGGSAT